MARIMKKIAIVDGTAKDLENLKKKSFRSYAAIAKVLEDGARVTVAVSEYLTGQKDPLIILAGYGEVERQGTSYTCPRRLSHGY